MTSVSIDPEEYAVYPGHGWAYTLKIDGQPDFGSNWIVKHPTNPKGPVIGEFEDGNHFHAYPEYRASSSIIEATSSDGKHKATAKIRLLVEAPYGLSKPALVDEFKIPGFIESIRWNDRPGARAALLIYDTLNQLPKDFLKAVGEVSIIRAKTLPEQAEGQHWPLLDNPVLIADDRIISKLQIEPFITPADEYFVEVFVHELAHVALAKRTISDLDRWMVIGSALTALGAVASPWVVLVPPSYIYLRYFSLLSGEDFASEYAKVTGWVVNNPNPLSFLWRDTTKTPNAVSGWYLLGQRAGLRNVNAPSALPIPIPPLPPDKELLRRDQAYQFKGFPDSYAGVDLHEDWASSVAAIAMHKPAASNTKFAPRRDFIVKSGCWPKTHPKIDPGKTYFSWARSQPPPMDDPDLRDFRIDFGPHSGKSRGALPIPIPAPTALRANSTDRKTGQVGVRAAVAAKESESESMGEGYSLPDAMIAVYGESFKALAIAAQHLARDQEHAGETTAAFAAGRDALETVASSSAEPTVMELLRTAECQGEGLLSVELAPAPEGEHGLTVSGRSARIGDLLVAGDGTYVAVSQVNSAGRILGVVAMPAIDAEEEKPRMTAAMFAPKQFRAYWRPSREPRAWIAANATHGEYEDLSAAMKTLVQLWGKTEGPQNSDLSTAGTFVAAVLSAAGNKHRGLIGGDGETVMSYLDRYGDGILKADKEGPRGLAVGDLVRFRHGGLWGVCLRVADDGAPVDVLVQGGAKGAFSEDENAITLQKGINPEAIGHSWRPSSQARR